MRGEWLILWPLLLGAQPKVVTGKLEVTAAGSNLAAQVRGFAGPTWVGYAVETVPAHRGYCMGSGNISEESTAYLEGERSAHVVFRVDKGEVERVRLLSPACQVDVDGLTLHWLTGVRTADSVSFLKSSPRLRSSISAIAAHADPGADAFLRETVESKTAARGDRDRAAHALTATRGANGFAIVRRLIDTEPDERLRESFTNAIAQAPGGAGTSTLMDLALKDNNRKVRERAFFWLGRSKDSKALKFMDEVLAR